MGNQFPCDRVRARLALAIVLASTVASASFSQELSPADEAAIRDISSTIDRINSSLDRIEKKPSEFPSQNPGGIVPLQAIYTASCRIVVQENNGVGLGSGTLFARNDTNGMVLSCAHNFATASQCICVFPNGERIPGRFHRSDHNDLSIVVLTQRPTTRPAPMADTPPTSIVTLCGYGGPNAGFRHVQGRVLNYSWYIQGSQHPYATIGASVRQGDSGGGCFDERGRLCGVIWGGDADGTSCVATGQPFLDIIASIWNDKPSKLVSISSDQVPLTQYGNCNSGYCEMPPQYYSQPPSRHVQQQPSISPQDLIARQEKLNDNFRVIDNNFKHTQSKLTEIEERVNALKSCACDPNEVTELRKAIAILVASNENLFNTVSKFKSCTCKPEDFPKCECDLSGLQKQIDELKASSTPSTVGESAPRTLEGIIRRVPK